MVISIISTFSLSFCLVKNKFGSWKNIVDYYKFNLVVTMTVSVISVEISYQNKSIWLLTHRPLLIWQNLFFSFSSILISREHQRHFVFPWQGLKHIFTVFLRDMSILNSQLLFGLQEPCYLSISKNIMLIHNLDEIMLIRLDDWEVARIFYASIRHSPEWG